MSTREIALVYWIVILLFVTVILSRRKSTTNSSTGFLRALKKLVFNPISMTIIIMNTIFLIFIFYQIRMFNLSISYWYIKDYLIILLFSIFPIVQYLHQLTLKELYSEKKKELLSIVAILLFVNSSYTFPILVEMILIFTIVILTLTSTVAEREPRNKIVVKLFDNLLMIISLIMITFSIMQFFNNISDLKTVDFWLSFGFEIIVWTINIPVIMIAKLMIEIERKVLFSRHKNNVLPYLFFYFKLISTRIALKEYFKIRMELKSYVEEAQEVASVGGNRIIITLNCEYISDEAIITLVLDAMFGLNRYSGIKIKREKYPNVIEIRNNNNELIAFWEDDFLADRWRGKNFPKKGTIELKSKISKVVFE